MSCRQGAQARAAASEAQPAGAETQPASKAARDGAARGSARRGRSAARTHSWAGAPPQPSLARSRPWRPSLSRTADLAARPPRVRLLHP